MKTGDRAYGLGVDLGTTLTGVAVGRGERAEMVNLVAVLTLALAAAHGVLYGYLSTQDESRSGAGLHRPAVLADALSRPPSRAPGRG